MNKALRFDEFISSDHISHLSSLKDHARTHAGEKLFHCDDCGKSFTTSRSLKDHERTHTGKKPFQCMVCGKSFAASSGQIRHQKNCTKNQNHPSPITTEHSSSHQCNQYNILLLIL